MQDRGTRRGRHAGAPLAHQVWMGSRPDSYRKPTVSTPKLRTRRTSVLQARRLERIAQRAVRWRRCGSRSLEPRTFRPAARRSATPLPGRRILATDDFARLSRLSAKPHAAETMEEVQWR